MSLAGEPARGGSVPARERCSKCGTSVFLRGVARAQLCSMCNAEEHRARESAEDRRFTWHRILSLEDELRAADVPFLRERSEMHFEVVGRVKGAAEIYFGTRSVAGVCTWLVFVDLLDRPMAECFGSGLVQRTLGRCRIEHAPDEFRAASRWVARRIAARRPVESTGLCIVRDFPYAITERARALHQDACGRSST